jgi:mannose-6-phosphate isomerase
MRFSEPLSFSPIYQERIWGGRALEEKLNRKLPNEKWIGESWEMVDRAEAQSISDLGDDQQMDLHTLWTQHRGSVFGPRAHASDRFPLLVKILDARESLSVQVHPSGKEKEGPALGEPKNEWWYILDAEPGAVIYAGFKHALSQTDFEHALAQGTAEAFLHRIPVQAGDSIYIPGGRCHAIGAGCLIAEVQQNSDTTFRVFDWNRTGPDGRPRALHIQESLACLDFHDVQPELAPALEMTPFSCEFFDVRQVQVETPSILEEAGGCVFLVLSGQVRVGAHNFARGEWFLLPSEAAQTLFTAENQAATLLQVVLNQKQN